MFGYNKGYYTQYVLYQIYIFDDSFMSFSYPLILFSLPTKRKMYTLFRIMNMSSQDRDKTHEIVDRQSNCKYNVIQIKYFIGKVYAQ